MKITYDIIENNLKMFEDAKLKFPIMQKYIDGEASLSSLQSVGLGQFGQFSDFIKQNQSLGIDIIMKGMTWRKLKPMLVTNTTLDRFKTYISNKTQNKFNDILKNVDLYDRLLNGRWVRKPSRRGSGARSGEKVSSFTSCRVAIINYIIQNEIEVHDKIDGLAWFHTHKLSLDNTLVREMKVTEDLLTSFVDTISDSKVDFKKLNINYVSNFLSDKLLKLMKIEKGDVVKCISNYVYPTGQVVLTEGKSYTVESSTMRSGYLNIYLRDDNGRLDFYPFSYFEDVAFHRNSILDSLFNDN